jgi:hypothetical protein
MCCLVLIKGGGAEGDREEKNGKVPALCGGTDKSGTPFEVDVISMTDILSFIKPPRQKGLSPAKKAERRRLRTNARQRRRYWRLKLGQSTATITYPDILLLLIAESGFVIPDAGDREGAAKVIQLWIEHLVRCRFTPHAVRKDPADLG